MVRKTKTTRSKKIESNDLGILERLLKYIATLQYKYALQIFIVFLLVTVTLGIGIGNIEFESDMQKEMPQDLPIYQLNDKVSDTYGGQDSVILLLEIDYNSDSVNSINDIRDAKVVNYIVELDELLKLESVVDSVTSIGMIFGPMAQKGRISDTQIDYILKNYPEISSFISDDYTSTMIIINADVGSSDKKLNSLIEVINKDIKSVQSVPGMKISITGNPSITQTIMTLLKSDSVFTLAVAGLIILCLLFVLEKSLTKGILVFAPLSFGLIWTIGTMGWIGLKISIATAGLGAMLLGLGVEYGVFILTRYKEERYSGKTQLQALQIAIPSVGSGMIGSGMTTIVGFLSLSLSIVPMLQHLGQSLALGIAFCLIAAILLGPVIIILEENFEHWITHYKIERLHKKREGHSRLAK